NGFFDGDADSFDQLAFSELNADEIHHGLVVFGAPAEGARGYEGPIRLKSQPRSAALGQAVLLNLETEGAGPVARVTVLRTATVTGAGDGDGQNLGATSSGDLLVATCRVLAVEGTGSITLAIEESSDDDGDDDYAAIDGLEATLTGAGVVRASTTAG